ncbi:unnamed protein product [Sympodiomycopsis kandeliae]
MVQTQLSTASPAPSHSSPKVAAPKPQRRVLQPSIPTRKTSQPKTTTTLSSSSSPWAATPSPRSTSTKSPSTASTSMVHATHAKKASDASTSSLADAWVDPEGEYFEQLQGPSSSPPLSSDPSHRDSSQKSQSQSQSQPSGLGISGLVTASRSSTSDPDSSADDPAIASSENTTPVIAAPPNGIFKTNPPRTPASPSTSASAPGSTTPLQNHSPFTPPSPGGPNTSSFATKIANSPGGRRKSKPDNLTISPQLSSPSTGTATATAQSPLIKQGLASPTVRGRTPPPTNPPTEPLPPLPSSASLLASTWSKRLSDEDKFGKQGPRMPASATLPASSSFPASSHPYAALRNIPPTSLVLQQAMGIHAPTTSSSTDANGRPIRLSDPATSDARTAVANSHIETLAGVQRAEAVLKAMQPEATFDQQQQQQQREQQVQEHPQLSHSHNPSEVRTSLHPATPSRNSDPEVVRLGRHSHALLDVPRDISPLTDDHEFPHNSGSEQEQEQEHLRDQDSHPGGRQRHDSETADSDYDDSEADSDMDSVQEVAIVRKGTLVSPMRKRETNGQDSGANQTPKGTALSSRAQLFRSSAGSSIVRRPGTGESTKEGAGSFFIGAAQKSQTGLDRLGSSTDDKPEQSAAADPRVSISSSVARSPTLTQNSHAHRNSLSADTLFVEGGLATKSESQSSTPTPGNQSGKDGVHNNSNSTHSNNQVPDKDGRNAINAASASIYRESTVDPMRNVRTSHQDTTNSATSSSAAHSRNESLESNGTDSSTAESTGSSTRDAQQRPAQHPSNTLKRGKSASALSSNPLQRVAEAENSPTTSAPLSGTPSAINNGKFSDSFGQIAIAFRQLQAEKRTLEKVIRATTPLDGLGDGGEDFVRYLMTMQSKLELSSSEMQKLLDLLERQRTVMDFMLETHQAEIDAHLDEIDDLRDELDEVIHNVEQLKAANTASQDALSAAQAESLARREEATKLRATLAERDDIAQVHDAAKAELEALRKERTEWIEEKTRRTEREKSLEEGKNSHSSRILALEAELASLVSTHSSQLERQSADHERELWNLKEEHEQALADNNAEIEKAADELAAHHKKALQILQDEQMQTTEGLQARISAMESSADAAMSARRDLMETVDAKDEQIAELMHEIEGLKANRDDQATQDLSRERDELKARVQEQQAELERLRSRGGGVASISSLSRDRSDSQTQSHSRSPSHSVSDSNSLSIDNAQLGKEDGITSTDSPSTSEDQSSAAGGLSSSDTISRDYATGYSSNGGHPSVSLPNGTPAEQIRHLMTQLTEQRARETQIRSAYKQLRDDHRRLQISHKDLSDRRRGSIGNFNLLPGASGPASTSSSGNGNGSSQSGGLLSTPPTHDSSSMTASSVAHQTPPFSASAIGSITNGQTPSPTTSRALKRLSLPLASNLHQQGSNNGGNNGNSGSGGVGLPEHILAALGGSPGGSSNAAHHRFPHVLERTHSHNSSISGSSGVVGLASFPHPPNSYRGPPPSSQDPPKEQGHSSRNSSISSSDAKKKMLTESEEEKDQ